MKPVTLPMLQTFLRRLGELIAQHSQAGDLAVVAVKQAIIIDVQPLGKRLLMLALYLDVHQHPCFCAIVALDLNELIGTTFTQFCVMRDLL